MRFNDLIVIPMKRSGGGKIRMLSSCAHSFACLLSALKQLILSRVFESFKDKPINIVLKDYDGNK